jgi:hypothetical protein
MDPSLGNPNLHISESRNYVLAISPGLVPKPGLPLVATLGGSMAVYCTEADLSYSLNPVGFPFAFLQAVAQIFAAFTSHSSFLASRTHVHVDFRARVRVAAVLVVPSPFDKAVEAGIRQQNC